MFGCAAMGIAILALQVSADETGKGTAKQVSDAEFVRMASAMGLAEVNMAKMALQNATRDDVKQFAKRMIDDHTQHNKELNRIADSKGFTPAATMDAAHEAMATRMSRMTGEQFDRQYMMNQVQDHQAAIALFNAESKNGRDPALKELATKSLPVLREHLEMARKLAGQGGRGATDRSGTGTPGGESRPRD